MSDSESSGSEDVEMEQDDVDMVDYDQEIAETKQKLGDDPYNIKLNNKLIGLLQKNGDFEELLEFRDKFVEWGPLDVELWINWIKDLRESGASTETIEAKFDGAIADNNSVHLWVERIAFGLRVSMDFARQKCEEAISAVGSQFDVGGILWLTFIDVEESHIPDLKNKDEAEKQCLRVANTILRALRVPSAEINDIYTRGQKFAQEHGLEVELKKMTEVYDATWPLVEEYDKLETKLVQNDYSSEVFEEYLQHEIEKDDPSRIQSIHERIIGKHNDNELAWIQYGTWCEQKLKVHAITCRVYERSVRQCPYSCTLYQQALLAFERAGQSNEKIDALWQSAKTNAISCADFGRALYRTYIYILRRRVTDSNYSAVGATFDEGAELLKEYFPNDWDPKAEYRRNQAWFYASKGNEIEKARLVWQDILASGFGKFAEKWIEAARLERQFGDNEHVRKLLNKALNSVSDNPNEIYEYYVQFEREEGTLEELDKVLEKVNAQIAHRASRPQKKEPEKGKKNKAQSQAQKRRDTPTKNDLAVERPAPKKPRLEAVTEEEELEEKKKDADGFAMPTMPAVRKLSGTSSPSPATSSKVSEGSGPTLKPSEDGKWTVFISNMDFKCTEEDVKKVLEGVREVRIAGAGQSKHRGFGFVEFDNEADARKALTKDRVLIKGRPLYISENNPEKRQSFKYSKGLEASKVFVRNVNFKATKDQIKELFSQFGAVKDVRIVTHKSGQPKGCAYVEFEAEQSAEKAVEGSKDKDLLLLGRTLLVLLSDPSKKPDTNASDKPSLGGGRTANAAALPRRGHAAMLGLVPRSARGPGGAKPATGASAHETTSTSGNNGDKSNDKPKAMSNDMFRQFLNK